MGEAAKQDEEIDDKIEKFVIKPKNESQGSSYINHGININRSNILLFPGGKIVALASLGLLAFVLAKYNIIGNDDISVSQAEEIQKLIKIVANCENRSTMKIYTELKRSYNVYNLKKIPESVYNDIKEELNLRKCEPPKQEAFLSHNTTIG